MKIKLIDQKRGKLLTILLVLAVIGQLLTVKSVISGDQLKSAVYVFGYVPTWYLPFYILIWFVSWFYIIGLWQWKKWAIYLQIAISLLYVSVSILLLHSLDLWLQLGFVSISYSFTYFAIFRKWKYFK